MVKPRGKRGKKKKTLQGVKGTCAQAETITQISPLQETSAMPSAADVSDAHTQDSEARCHENHYVGEEEGKSGPGKCTMGRQAAGENASYWPILMGDLI